MTGNNPPLRESELAGATLEEIHSALFEQLVGGHAQMALTFLGKIPNPQTGELEEPDLEAGKIFIDQLEMLTAKTEGNLSEKEKNFLDKALGTARAAFAGLLNKDVGE